MNFGLLPLLRRLVRVGFKGIEIGFAGTRNREGRDAIGVAYAEDIFEGTEC